MKTISTTFALPHSVSRGVIGLPARRHGRIAPAIERHRIGTGVVQAADGKTVAGLGKYAAGEKLSLVITADDRRARAEPVRIPGATSQDRHAMNMPPE